MCSESGDLTDATWLETVLQGLVLFSGVLFSMTSLLSTNISISCWCCSYNKQTSFRSNNYMNLHTLKNLFNSDLTIFPSSFFWSLLIFSDVDWLVGESASNDAPAGRDSLVAGHARIKIP